MKALQVVWMILLGLWMWLMSWTVNDLRKRVAALEPPKVFYSASATTYQIEGIHPDLFSPPFKNVDFENQAKVEFHHGLKSLAVRFQCYQQGYGFIEWDSLTLTDRNTAVIEFPKPTTAYCQAKKVETTSPEIQTPAGR